MITRAQKARLGLFVTVALLGLSAGLIAVLGHAVWEKRDVYIVRYTESVSGLEVGAQVKYNGVRVGRVEKLSIDPEDVSRTVVEFTLHPGTPVKEDAKVVMNMFGITGLKFLEIRGGTNQARSLPPGSEVQAGTSIVDDLTVRAEALSRKIEIAVNNIIELTGETNRQRVSQLLESLDSLAVRVDGVTARSEKDIQTTIREAGRAAQHLTETLQNAKRAVEEARGAIKNVSQAAVEAMDREKVDAVLDDARLTLGDARSTMGEAKARLGEKGLAQSIKKLDRFLERASKFIDSAEVTLSQTREGIYEAVQNLAESSENLRDFSRIIREDPSLLLGGSRREERRLP